MLTFAIARKRKWNHKNHYKSCLTGHCTSGRTDRTIPDLLSSLLSCMPWMGVSAICFFVESFFSADSFLFRFLVSRVIHRGYTSVHTYIGSIFLFIKLYTFVCYGCASRISGTWFQLPFIFAGWFYCHSSSSSSMPLRWNGMAAWPENYWIIVPPHVAPLLGIATAALSHTHTHARSTRGGTSST